MPWSASSSRTELLADQGIGSFTLQRIGIPDHFIEHGAASVLRKKYGLDAEGIVAAVQKMVTKESTEPLPAPKVAVK